MSDLLENLLTAVVAGERFGENYSQLCCPVCADIYLYPTKVEVNAGGSITEVTAGGTVMRAGEPAGRGVAIDVILECESGGHECRFRIHLHKGFTCVDVEHVKTDDPYDADGCLRAGYVGTPVIWRD